MKNTPFLFIIILINSLCSAQRSWQPINNYPGTSRPSSTSFTIGDKAYVGTGGRNFNYTNEFWEYDTITGVWSQKANVGGPLRSGAVGFSINGKGYLGLGRNTNQLYYDLWEYDVNTNVWSFKTMFPGSNSSSSSVFVLQNKSYIVTGATATNIGNESNDCWEYDPVTDNWTQKSSIPSSFGRSRAVAYSIDGKGYVFCGYSFNSVNNTQRFLKEVWEYDSITDNWQRMADYPGNGNTDCAGFSLNNFGYLGLGVYDNTDFWRFNPTSNSWIQVDSFIGQGRIASTSFSVGDKGFVGLGYEVNSQGTINYSDFYQFRDQTLSNSTLNYDLVKVFPNPFTTTINIECRDFSSVDIFNANGRIICSLKTSELELPDLKSGIYFLKINMRSESSQIFKVIKK